MTNINVITRLLILSGVGLLLACSQSSNEAPTSAPNTQAVQAPSAGAMGDAMGDPTAGQPPIPEGMVEIVLKDKLDGDLSGYCLDIVGGGPNVDPAGGLQSHTCYSYRGALGADQAIDPNLLAGGIIKLAAYDVCATVDDGAAGMKIGLSACDGSKAQSFVQGDLGTISPAVATKMCLTAGEETVRGRNGTSPHQIKTLELQFCSADMAKYQEWRSRTKED